MKRHVRCPVALDRKASAATLFAELLPQIAMFGSPGALRESGQTDIFLAVCSVGLTRSIGLPGQHSCLASTTLRGHCLRSTMGISRQSDIVTDHCFAYLRRGKKKRGGRPRKKIVPARIQTQRIFFGDDSTLCRFPRYSVIILCVIRAFAPF